MNKSKYAIAALCAAMAGTAWSDAIVPVHGRAGMPVGSDRHTYIVDTARPPSFDMQLQAEAGPGRAGGQAVNALANVRPALSRVADGDHGMRTLAYGRAGYVPEFLLPPAQERGNRRSAGVNPGASAERPH